MNSRKRVLILIVSYNAEAFIRSVLERIPAQVWNNEAYETRALIIDDQSKDKTFQRAREFAESFAHKNIRVLYNPVNQGYGGNQKIGYHYALKSNFDVVVLLHGDGQYAPEYLDRMVAPIIHGEADVVLGSRMLRKVDALKGGMPLYKWLGNQLLSKIQNLLLGSKLAEFHTGYRAYSVEALRTIPFQVNSDYFDFDTDIIIQLLHTRKRIAEISIPTYYGKEISYVNGLKYGWLILMTTLQSKLSQLGIFYNPKFDYNQESQHYTLKLGYESSHQFALSRVQPGAGILDVGSGPGYMAKQLANMGAVVTSVDRHITLQTSEYSHRTIACDIEA